MKRFLSLVAASVMAVTSVFAFAGCGATTEGSDSQSGSDFTVGASISMYRTPEMTGNPVVTRTLGAEGPDEGKEYFAKACEKWKDDMTVHPSHGNFVLVEFKSYETKIALLNYLAEHNIFVRDTTQASCVHKCFRITIGTKEQMWRVVKVIDGYYGK